MTKRWVNVGAPVAIMMVFLWMVTFREEKLLLKKDVLLHPVLRTGKALLNKGEHIKGEVHCNALVAHSSGHWKHDYAQLKYNHSSDFHQNQTSINYFPEELDWIQGRNVPNTFDRSMCGVYPTLAMMYISQNGNQVGDAIVCFNLCFFHFNLFFCLFIHSCLSSVWVRGEGI